MATYDSTDTDTPVGEDDDFLRLKAQFREDYEASLEWREEAVTDYAFHAGHGQWDEADKKRLEAQQRPCITFNRIAPVVASVVGQEINQRAEVTYKPRTTQQPEPNVQLGQFPGQPGAPQAGVAGADDTGPAETITAAAAYLRDQCDAEDEESDAFQDTVICGMGWVESRVVYDENPDGDLREDRIDPLEMVWDCKAIKRNLEDKRRVWRVREIDKYEAKEMFPGKDMSLLDASWARMAKNTQPHDREAARYYESDSVEDYDPNRKTVTLVECQYYQIKTVYKTVGVDPETRQVTGEPVELKSQREADNYAKNAFTATGQHVPVAKHKKRVYRTAIIGKEILSDEESQSQECFKYQAITGYRDRNSKQWVGLVRAMRDPQRWANALFSSVLHQIQTTGKGIMAERGAFENDQRAEQDWANGSKIVWLKTGAIAGKQIQQKEQHALPAGMFDLMQFSLSAFRDVTGVNIESMGLADRSQAASLEMQRTKQAGVILAGLFDGLRRFRKENGRLLLDLIRNYLSDGRLVRVVGPDYEQYVPLIKQDDTIDYDIIVDESPTSPNQKEMSWAILQQLLPVLGDKLTATTGPILLKASPLPLAVVNEFAKAAKKEAEAAAQQPNPEMMKIQADMQLKQMDAAQREREGQQQMAITQQKGAIDMQLGQMNLQLKAIEVELAKFQAGIDLQTAQLDAQSKSQEMDFRRQEMHHEMQNARVTSEQTRQKGEMDLAGKHMQMAAQGQKMQAEAEAREAESEAADTQTNALAKSIEKLAEAIAKPKTAKLSADGMTATVQ